ncbi:MAG: cysteine desulfurase [Oscillospiraceae bacterium]|jgi:cysteine desulfurase|nr:cysteine desulfurase [Oscillospiraceae bacterium]
MIYFDNNATTSTDRDAAQKAYDIMTGVYGNPSSLHHFGMDAFQELGDARYKIARLIGAKTRCVHFTSGGTDSNNMAILGAARANRAKGHHIVTTQIEHGSVLECCSALEKQGFEVTYVQPNPVTRAIEAKDIVHAVRSDTILVSMMQVNSETGEILPLKDVIDGVKKKNPETYIHCDAVQGLGKIPFNVYHYPVDLMSMSAHKIHGPKGIGALYVKQGCSIDPIKYGGPQEGHLNPGTESVPLAAAFGTAADKKLTCFQKNADHVSRIKKHLEERLLKEVPACHFNGPKNTSPYVLNFSVPGYSSGEMVDYFSMHDIFISAGSACSKGALSHVLQAEGYEMPILSSALRISFCETNTIEETDSFMEVLKSAFHHFIK